MTKLNEAHIPELLRKIKRLEKRVNVYTGYYSQIKILEDKLRVANEEIDKLRNAQFELGVERHNMIKEISCLNQELKEEESASEKWENAALTAEAKLQAEILAHEQTKQAFRTVFNILK